MEMSNYMITNQQILFGLTKPIFLELAAEQCLPGVESVVCVCVWVHHRIPVARKPQVVHRPRPRAN